jgi:predicted metal-binding protein
VKHHLIVCTTCRDKTESRAQRGGPAGARLFASLTSRLDAWSRRRGIEIVGVECLGACTRPCVVALRADGKHTYLLGDLGPMRSELALVECTALFADSPTGNLPRESRPPALRGSVIGRIPPVE